MEYVAIALGWAASNAVAIVAGGYLYYRFGHIVEPIVRKMLGLLVKP